MKLVVPKNDPAALKCLIAASAGGVAVYQIAGQVRSRERCDSRPTETDVEGCLDRARKVVP
jgi:hypothetical protein